MGPVKTLDLNPDTASNQLRSAKVKRSLGFSSVEGDVIDLKDCVCVCVAATV